MKIYHGGPRYKEDERMHWLSKKRYKIGLVIPTLVVYMVFIIIPIGMSIGYSFTKYSGIGKATFNGLTNYMRLFKDRLFWITLKNTMIMFILAFVLLLSLSFLIALLLNNKLKGVDFSLSSHPYLEKNSLNSHIEYPLFLLPIAIGVTPESFSFAIISRNSS
jgi:raffinose/stachyose/melibiose transport system permease protein